MAHVLSVEWPRDEDGEVDDAEDAAVLGDGGALGLGHDGVERRLGGNSIDTIFHSRICTRNWPKSNFCVLRYV